MKSAFSFWFYGSDVSNTKHVTFCLDICVALWKLRYIDTELCGYISISFRWSKLY